MKTILLRRFPTHSRCRPARASGPQVGLWVLPGDTPASFEWSIGTSPAASNVSSGTSPALSNTFEFTNSSGADVYETTFALSGAVSTGTTYYLTLYNSFDNTNNSLYWDINNGPSVAWENSAVPLDNYLFPGSNSETFQLYSPSSVPEPSSMALAVIGAAGTLGMMYSRRRRTRGLA